MAKQSRKTSRRPRQNFSQGTWRSTKGADPGRRPATRPTTQQPSWLNEGKETLQATIVTDSEEHGILFTTTVFCAELECKLLLNGPYLGEAGTPVVLFIKDYDVAGVRCADWENYLPATATTTR